MNRTEHDLSFNSTKLDYQALIRTSIIAFAHTRNKIERLVQYTHTIGETNFASTSRLIAEEAEKLVVVAETWYTLEEGLTRQELIIVNKPEVKDETNS
ncbi:hypothetical protein LCGC14_0393040 [marine sediment metagenome]|uniref:Uncharacterized protein n=1 Tax=marine sediment metagenome TaxID=412755 RepID=A0A0F9W818_9ZZZZ